MIVGSVHTIETLEFFYWLKRTGYDGWYSIDQYPYREDSLGAVAEGVNAMEAFARLADQLPEDRLEQLLATGDAAQTAAFLRELLLQR